ncbi:MAG: peptidoglycan-binding protein [Alphaproteobacteria bacterium]
MLRSPVLIAAALAVLATAGCAEIRDGATRADARLQSLLGTDEAPLPAPAAPDETAQALADIEAAPDEAARVAATKRLRAQAEAGDARAQFAYALALRSGRGVARDPAAAADWLERAARQQVAPAAYLLGLAYWRGEGVAQDDGKAVEWLLRAAAQNNPGAQYQLGIAHREGRGVAPDERAALDWFERAATLGHAEAQYVAGAAYLNGRGTKADSAWAVRWLGKAAEQGIADAQYLMALASAAGSGLPKSSVAAYAWASRAAAQGHARATELRAAMDGRLDPGDRAAAEWLNARWRPVDTAYVDARGDRPTVTFVQVALTAIDEKPGRIDGVLGPMTRGAIAAAQRRLGLTVTGTIDEQTLQALRRERLAHQETAERPS